MSDPSSLVSVRLPDALRREIDEIARETRRSRSFVVKQAVASYVEERRAYLEAIDEALVEADEGVFVSGEKVFDWLSSWGTSDERPVPEADIHLPRKP